MIKHDRGTLILDAVPNSEVEQKIGVFLARHLKNIPSEKVAVMVKNTPVVLCKNISEKMGKFVVANLEKLGASATYVPEESVVTEKSSETNHMRPPQESFSQEATQAIQPRALLSKPYQLKRNWKDELIRHVSEVNKELWLILSMIVIVGIMNYLVTSNHMLLGFYNLPTLFSAYFFGRRHATMTAFASILLVSLVVYYNPDLFNKPKDPLFVEGRWYNITAWGSILVITAYAMGTLYEHNAAKMQELRKTYQGLMVILRHFISKDKYTENHCYRVSIYAAKIAAYLGFDFERIEDIRSAALLHDIGKLDISRELLYKAAQLTQEEFESMKRHVEYGVEMLEPLGGPLGRIIPIILAHHDKYDGSGYYANKEEEIPLEARVLMVADVYDSLVSDRPYRKAMSPFEVKEIIVKGSGTEFDPKVVDAFLKAFHKGEMEVPNLVI